MGCGASMDDTEEYYGATAAYTTAEPQDKVPKDPARAPSPSPAGLKQQAQPEPPDGQFHTTTQLEPDYRRPPPPPLAERISPTQEEVLRLNTATPPRNSDQAAHEEQVRLYPASTPSESPRHVDPEPSTRTSLSRIVTFASPPPRVVVPPPPPLSDATTAVLQDFDEVKMNLQASRQHWDQVINSLKQELALEEVELKEIQMREGPVRKMLAAIEGSKEEQPDEAVVATLRAVMLQAKEARDKIADIKKKIQRVLPKQVLYAKLIALHGTVGAEGSDVGSVTAEGDTDDDGEEGETEEGEEGEEEDEEEDQEDEE